MTKLEFDNGDSLYFDHQPGRPGRPLFAFFNALTGDVAMWDSHIAPALRAEGFGTLLFNYRGQQDSPISADVTITAAQMTADAKKLLALLGAPNVVSVGLSIGGYFAIRAHLGGTPFAGHVLLNTLRVDGPRLAWINAAVHRASLTGGGALVRDLYAPLLFNEAWQAQNRSNFLKDEPYEPLSETSEEARLLASGSTADWSLDWEEIRVPVQVVTGVQDRVFRDADAIEAILRRLPNAEATDLPQCGHMIPVEDPDAAVRACLRLAERLP